MKDRYTYDEAFEILSGLTIDHVEFLNNGTGDYVRDKFELQRKLDNITDIFNSFVKFTLGDANDDGVSKEVIILFFDPITKILKATSSKNSDYQFVNELVGTNKELHYDTFKQVFRTDWDWEWKGIMKTKFNRIKTFFGFN
jgi:hypothetical protein